MPIQIGWNFRKGQVVGLEHVKHVDIRRDACGSVIDLDRYYRKQP